MSRYYDYCHDRCAPCRTCCVINTPLPPVPPTPPVSAVQALQVQLQGSSGGTLADNANVIFDTVVLNTSSAISYDSTTGIFTINAPGVYLVNWWVNTDGADVATPIILSVEMGATAISSETPPPFTTVQLYGQGLFEVGLVPRTFSLVNRTGGIVGYATSSVQADLVVFKL